MKKSNKLLLGGFLFLILMIAGIHIALYAKYKSGDYTLHHRRDYEKNERVQFPNVSLVIFRNVRSAAIQFGDTATIRNDRDGIIKYEQIGDSLIITDNTNHDYQPNGRLEVNITLPYNVTIETDSLSALLLQSRQSLKAKITTVPNNP